MATESANSKRRKAADKMLETMREYANGLEQKCKGNDFIMPEMYDKYGVNLGLRDKNGNGVPHLQEYGEFQLRLRYRG